MDKNINYYLTTIREKQYFSNPIKITKTEYNYLKGKTTLKINSVFIILPYKLVKKKVQQMCILGKNTVKYIQNRKEEYLIITSTKSPFKISKPTFSGIEKLINYFESNRIRYSFPPSSDEL